MASFYSYNIIGGEVGARAHLQRLKPTTVFYMDAGGGANWAAQNLPGCKVIHRVYTPLEDTMHRTPGATLAYLQARASEGLDGRVYINLSCEPQLSRADDLQRLIDEQLTAFQWAKQAGVRVAGPHFAHYGLDERHWATVEPLTTFIAQNASQFLFTADEYFAGHAFSGVLHPGLPGGNEAGHIQPETWKASPVPYYYHVGRVTNLFRWLQERGKPLPPTVITEAGADALGDVTQWRNSLIKSHGYTDIRGWKSLTAQWQAWYGNRGWSPQRAYLEMLVDAWREIYKPWPNVIGAQLYCWGTNNDPQWNQFRLDEADAAEFRQRLETVTFETGAPPVTNPTPSVTPGDKGAPVRVRLRTTSFINVRNAPATTATALANPPRNKALMNWYPATKRRNENYDWYWIEVDGGPSGWQAQVVEYPEEQWIMPEAQAITFRVPAQYQHVILAGGKFDAPRNYSFNPAKLQKHEGLDFSSLHAAPQPRLVVAPHSGVVQKVVLNDQYYGQYVRMSFGKGFRGYFAHLSKVLVTVGQTVQEGDVIGHEGQTGNASGPHLHWTVVQIGYGLKDYVVDDVVNPEPLLRAATTPEPEPEPEPTIPPDLYAAILAQTTKLEHAHNALIVAQQTYAMTVAEVNESLKSVIGYS